MKKVYAVNSGCYSDYRINAIFSTRERAEEFMGAVPATDYNAIEEYELDPPAADLIRRGYAVWRVRMLKDGTVENVQHGEIDVYEVTDIGHSIWRRSQALAYQRRGLPDALISVVWAKTKQGAVKIANEHRAQMIATGEWA